MVWKAVDQLQYTCHTWRCGAVKVHNTTAGVNPLIDDGDRELHNLGLSAFGRQQGRKIINDCLEGVGWNGVVDVNDRLLYWL